MKTTLILLILVASSLSFALPKELEMPPEVKEKYAYLYSLPIEKLPNGVSKFHEAKLWERNGIRILSLKGDRFEMAYQHGRLLKEEIKTGVLPVAAQMLKNSAKTTLPNLPFVTEWLIQKLYEMVPDKMITKMKAEIPETFSDLSYDSWGLSESTAISPEEIAHGMLGPESVMVLFGMVAESPLDLQVTPMANACSAFAAWGEKTQSGKLLIGRNTDFGLNGYYDRYPTAIYFEPTNGDQKYVSFGSAGIHLAGVSGYNESGIFLAIHLIPTLDVSANSVPAFIMGQEVLRKAHNFNEAIQILSSTRPSSGWTFTLASTKENKVASVEFSHGKMGILMPEGNIHVQTNHYRTAEVKEKYYPVNNSVVTDSLARAKRMQDLLNSSSIIDKNIGAKILSDKTDPINHQVRGVGNTVSVHTTMTSLVVDANANRIYMAKGRAPVSLNEFISLPMFEDLSQDDLDENNFETLPTAEFPTKFPKKAQAESFFIEAKMALEYDNDLKTAESKMKLATQTDSSNPIYFFSLAVFQMKNGHMDQAKESLQKVTELYDAHLSRVAHYYLGRIYAKSFQKAKAREHLQFVISTSNEETEKKLYPMAKEVDSKVATLGFFDFNPSKIAFLMQEGDCIGYK